VPPGRSEALAAGLSVIDLHFHCLPGIDDGPESWDQAVALCRAAAAGGATTLVATPHVLRGGWLNEDPGRRDELILRLNTLLGSDPAILPGCEYLFSSDVLELVEKGPAGPITALNRSRFVLMEFPAIVPLRVAESAFHELSLAGVVPVVAHPERQAAFQREPEALARLVRRGALVQVTAGSLLGEFGDRAQAAADEFFHLGLVHLVGSDAHDLVLRPPRLAQAREEVRALWGREAEAGLFESNPRAVLASEPVPWLPGTMSAARKLR
jgi:protein-tyrosine phosphatase